jgi:hypothetical protein
VHFDKVELKNYNISVVYCGFKSKHTHFVRTRRWLKSGRGVSHLFLKGPLTMPTTIYCVLFKWVRNNDYFKIGEEQRLPRMTLA